MIFFKFWCYFYLVEWVKFGGSGHFLEKPLRKWPDILHDLGFLDILVMRCGFSSLWCPFEWNWSYLGFLGIIWRTYGSTCRGGSGVIFPTFCVEFCLVRYVMIPGRLMKKQIWTFFLIYALRCLILITNSWFIYESDIAKDKTDFTMLSRIVCVGLFIIRRGCVFWTVHYPTWLSVLNCSLSDVTVYVGLFIIRRGCVCWTVHYPTWLSVLDCSLSDVTVCVGLFIIWRDCVGLFIVRRDCLCWTFHYLTWLCWTVHYPTPADI